LEKVTTSEGSVKGLTNYLGGLLGEFYKEKKNDNSSTTFKKKKGVSQ